VHVFYLHGFASSPLSSKAQFFAERLARYEIGLHALDFNLPEFGTLTVSRMLQQVEEEISARSPGSVVLIGSSLGGFVAVEAAARQRIDTPHPIERLVLLAPAVELEWDRWIEIVDRGGVEAWRRAGEIEVFHYAHDAPRKLKFSFYVDARQYTPANRRLSQPMLIFQGRRDESVSPAIVERFAKSQPRATLHLVDDGHQLKNSLDFIWTETARFLSITT
jgi:pimeloyl-ACP methyl ester carboxylesterase